MPELELVKELSPILGPIGALILAILYFAWRQMEKYCQLMIELKEQQKALGQQITDHTNAVNDRIDGVCEVADDCRRELRDARRDFLDHLQRHR